MKILYITSYYKPAYIYGGPTRSVSALCEGLARLGATVTVLTTNANGAGQLDVPVCRPINVDGVTVHYYPVAGGLPSSFFYSPSLAQACQEMVSSYDLAILETFFTYPTGPAVAACLKTKTPYIIPLRGQLLPWALRQKTLKKQIYLSLVGRHYLNHAAALQCTDPIELESLKKLRLIAPAFVVPNGLDTSAWAQLPSRGALRRRFGIPEKDKVLLMLGRLHRVKNPELGLEMFGQLQRTDVHLVFAGPDEEGFEPCLNLRATALGLGGKIHFTGLLTGESLLQAMADADLFMMTSIMESFGMAAVEAMAAGLPVLLSEHVPVGRWVEEAGAGKQVACTPEAFASACDEMFVDPQRLKEMGRGARALATQRFDTPMVAKQMLAQYQAIASQGKPLLDIQNFKLVKV
jgi:glycosyltransferase involved in cell wall biosynthesis